MTLPNGLELELWKRVAVTFIVVSLILMVGKVMPLAGVAIMDTLHVCHFAGGGVGFLPLMYSCPGPMVPHQEVLITPHLGSVAVIAFFAIWLRRRLAKQPNETGYGQN